VILSSYVADFVGGRFSHLMHWWAIWSFYVLVGDFSLGELGVDDFSMGDFVLGNLSCSLALRLNILSIETNTS